MPAAVVAALDTTWAPRRALAVEVDGEHALRAWATPDDKEAVTQDILEACEGLGLAAEAAPVPEASEEPSARTSRRASRATSWGRWVGAPARAA